LVLGSIDEFCLGFPTAAESELRFVERFICGVAIRRFRNMIHLPDEGAQGGAAVRLLRLRFVEARREAEERQVLALPAVERDLRFLPPRSRRRKKKEKRVEKKRITSAPTPSTLT